MGQKVAETRWYRIYMAGDFEIAKQKCRKYYYGNGLCVNIHPTHVYLRRLGI